MLSTSPAIVFANLWGLASSIQEASGVSTDTGQLNGWCSTYGRVQWAFSTDLQSRSVGRAVLALEVGKVRTTIAGGEGVRRRLQLLGNMAMALMTAFFTGGGPW